MLLFLCTFLFVFSTSIEHIGFYVRFIGIADKNSALGYSMHVQLATFSRAGTVLSALLLSLSIERGGTGISLIVILSILLSGLVIGLSSGSKAIEECTIKALFSYYRLFKKRLGCIDLDVAQFDVLQLLKIPARIKSESANTIRKGIFCWPTMYTNSYASNISAKRSAIFQASVFLSYLFTIGGFYLVYLLAIHTPEYRLTLLSTAPLITGLGTALSSTIVDPSLSAISDSSCYLIYLRRLNLIKCLTSLLLCVGFLFLSGNF